MLATLDPRPSKAEILLAIQSIEGDLQARYPTMRYSDILARMHAELEARLTGKPNPPDVFGTPDAVSEVSTSDTKTKTRSVGLAGEGQSSGNTGEKGGVDLERHLQFSRSLANWPIFPDTIPALTQLSKHFKLCVLSNVDKTSFSHTQRALEGPPDAKHFSFTAIYTAEDAGAYKPDPVALHYALRRLKEDWGIEKEEVLVTAQSVFHDLIPARREGVKGAWINRRGASMGLEGVNSISEGFEWEFETLGAMADSVEKEAKGED